jgi:hypothetical protein
VHGSQSTALRAAPDFMITSVLQVVLEAPSVLVSLIWFLSS